MTAFAHSHPDFPDPRDAVRYWEPLFTPFGGRAGECTGENCPQCESLAPGHEEGLRIQDRFRPEPLYKHTGKGHFDSRTVEETPAARKIKEVPP